MSKRPAVKWTAMIAAALLLAACGNHNDKALQGWVEADLVFVSPDENGRVETLAVREGDNVETGGLLFTLDSDLQRADVMQAQATLTNARQALERAAVLLKSNAGTQKTYEDAEAAVRTAEARLNSAQTRLARRRMVSPATGSIQQVYFRVGEMPMAGKPVVSVLPPNNIKIRFFVSEPVLPKVVIGNAVQIRCDGCKDNLTGRISFISRTSEYTPPVIFSQEERSKLVFLVEARPDQPELVRVGQPVDVTLVLPETAR
jgi:HlyD family secretion protein